MNPNPPNITGGQWYALRGTDQLVSEDTTLASLRNAYVFTNAEKHGDTFADASMMAAAPLMYQRLKEAILRVELANQEGDQILSAWLKDARIALAEAEGGRYARKCDITGMGMNEGWMFGSGEQYAATKEAAEQIARERGNKDLDEAFEDNDGFWTQWELEEEIKHQEGYYTYTGDWIAVPNSVGQSTPTL
ncbi:MAG TPA: hypothetical protein VGH19_06900 [Verrucomicrobiae bacterium]